MSSDTPRTGAVYFTDGKFSGFTVYDLAGFARALERELTAARARIEEMEARVNIAEERQETANHYKDVYYKMVDAERAAHLATQRSLVRLADACDRVQDWHDTRIGDALYLDIVEETRAAVAKADKPKN